MTGIYKDFFREWMASACHFSCPPPVQLAGCLLEPVLTLSICTASLVHLTPAFPCRPTCPGMHPSKAAPASDTPGRQFWPGLAPLQEAPGVGGKGCWRGEHTHSNYSPASLPAVPGANPSQQQVYSSQSQALQPATPGASPAHQLTGRAVVMVSHCRQWGWGPAATTSTTAAAAAQLQQKGAYSPHRGYPPTTWNRMPSKQHHYLQDQET